MQKSKYKSLKVRAVSTVVIIASFIIVIYLGHVPLLMMMILAIQVGKVHSSATCSSLHCVSATLFMQLRALHVVSKASGLVYKHAKSSQRSAP